MGLGWTQEEFDRSANQIYEDALKYQRCLLPDIGIDESLQKYSGLDSNAVLQAYSEEMLKTAQGQINHLGSVLSPMTSNAVGLGAFVISLIIEIIIKGGTQKSENTYSMFRRVFGEEKASSVRDTISEYVKRHRIYMNNDQQLVAEISRLEKQLSNHLTILRNSLLHDEQMSSRGFKIWVNGAALHILMLIHETRLNIQTNQLKSENLAINDIKRAIDLYLENLKDLLHIHKTYNYKINSQMFRTYSDWGYPYSRVVCWMEHIQIKSCIICVEYDRLPEACHHKEVQNTFINIVYSKYEQINGLESYFLKIRKNLRSLIHQSVSFALPSAAG